MKTWHMIIDVEKCEDCNNCLLACKDEYVNNEWKGYSKPQPNLGQKWINVQRKERGTFPLIDVAYRPTPCMNCDDAPCIKASKGCASKRSDGIVIIDPEKSKGREDLVKSCPYDVIWWNAELNIPQKCTFCAHLKDEGWKEPRCVQVCPTGALRIENLTDEEFSQIIENEKLEVLHKELKTSPRVYYKNLYRFEKCFIVGSVSIKKDGIVDCAEDARVVLYKEKVKIEESITDNYGDFKFDKLDEDSGEYTLEVSYKDKKSKTITVNVAKSINVGEILFD
ncbi:oxidoreductase [Alkalibaculum sp. M08DMB]|uniref:Oxidoreductase n=1 Tax=Alkalibaculum sporogenes TaxID=2655001 RepID=A0A6A7K5W1_9FIRM|nr:4Fe-4S dicluster domain-containing protein [Alkalibaculum sporogenes]MPW24721.1 oxidoreductase [Alkalibaculum sporogenes]